MLIKGEDGVLFCQKLLRAVLDMVVDFFPGGALEEKSPRETFGHGTKPK
jgi:hypothetical protein